MSAGDPKPQADARRLLVQYLEGLSAAGVTHLRQSKGSASTGDVSASGRSLGSGPAGRAATGSVAGGGARTGSAPVSGVAGGSVARGAVPGSSAPIGGAPGGGVLHGTAPAAIEPAGGAPERPVLGEDTSSVLPPTMSRPAAHPTSLFDEPTTVPKLSRHERNAQLEVIRQEVAACSRCGELASSRTQTVFGVGNTSPRLCFVGEAPGADEDRQGEPFVGKAGQLLTRIIEACTLRREDVYILNVLKCRPPDNRTPLPGEVAHCRGYLERQLSILRPEFICCLGAVASHTLLDTSAPMGRLRGTFHQYDGMRVLCTYHPAYLLRNPPAKRQVWEDMQMLMQAMGIEVPASGT